MSAVALMYHDVTPPGAEDTSGFPGGDAARYKLTPSQFRAHLAAIAVCVRRSPVRHWFLTFDDGGSSAEAIADALEEFGWRGHFFVTTACIGTPGFLNGAELRRLRGRGHVIGSHSHTHPLRMARCSEPRLREEWRQSVDVLRQTLGEPVATASVPGGHSSDLVALTAAEAGITCLFTSQPTTRGRRVGACLVLGRYVVQRNMTAATAAAIVAGHRGARLRPWAAWSGRRILKTIGGPLYLRARARILGASPDVRWGDDLPQRFTGPSPSPRIR